MINSLVAHLLRVVRYDDSLLFSGDVPGFVISVYTTLLGQFFGGIVLLTTFALIYIRTNDLLYVSILWLLVGGGFEVMIPTAGLSIAKLFIIFGIAGGLYSLFSRGRRGSG